MNWPQRDAFEHGRNYWPALASELFAPALRWHARSRARGPQLEPRHWRRILILGDHHLGDTLYRLAALQAAVEFFPRASFHLVCAPQVASLLDGHPLLAAVHPFYTRADRSQLSADAMGSLKKINADAVICTSLWRSHQDLHLSVKLGIPNRASYADKGFSGRVTHPLKRPTGLSYPHAILDQLYQLAGRQDALPEHLRPELYISPASKELARKRMLRLGFGAGKVVAVFTTTRQPVATWAEEPFSSLIREMMRRKWGTLLLGAADDAPRLKRIGLGSGLKPPTLAGEVEFDELAAILKQCDAVICPDSGPRHLANAVGTPVWFFRNLRSDPVETGVYADTETDLVPAGLRVSGLAEQRVILDEIRPRDIATLLDG